MQSGLCADEDHLIEWCSPPASEASRYAVNTAAVGAERLTYRSFTARAAPIELREYAESEAAAPRARVRVF